MDEHEKLPRNKIFNLLFRPGSNSIEVEGYKFDRVNDYPHAIQKLQHYIASIGSEFTLHPNTGEHVHTADVTIPNQEPPAVLDWEDSNATGLDDIVLLLTLFTGRDVFRVLLQAVSKPH